MQDAELRELITFAGSLADAARDVIRPHFRAPLAVENKKNGGEFDPVTIADRDAENIIRERIMEKYPEHGVLGEEFGHTLSRNGFTWCIDPIDGTRAFITGVPQWGVLIALFEDETPVLGIMDQPYTGERFTGSRFGATLTQGARTTRLRTRACAGLDGAVLTTTHPGAFGKKSEHEAYLRVAAQTRLHRYGGDCYAYAMLAHGLIDLVIETALQPYDIQALIPIIEAAGGVITNWRGGPAHHGGQVIAAGDARLHAAALAIVQPDAE
ncbi:MAG TPA: histidinol-phosphatase [Alphaproteobacteria bacterium]|jgi:histidinol phosphatase-like enzyme (inositol monophosphatase family)|nr:histidinol-phosphatase [Alphaproteobacteria bacterium]